jgi:hypothetical protein
MAYKATVVPVMIASPGDVLEDREVIRDVLHTWNYINSLRTQVVLMPVGWETHSSPELGTRAQELINERVLKDCDLLVGVFWTRLGSPTGVSPSGTVEEIEKHIKDGKPAMIYFSSKPVAPQSLNQDQYSALIEFKSQCKQMGLIEEHENLGEFRQKFTRQLELCLQTNPHLQSIITANKSSTNEMNFTSIDQSSQFPGSQLSEEAKTLLKEASQDNNGIIMKIAVMGGRFIQTNSRSFGGERGRESAKWEYALNQLVDDELVIEKGHKGEVFEVTHKGYELADMLLQTGDL